MKPNTNTICFTVTGPSGCGKSSLMRTIEDRVRGNGYTISQVVRFGREFDFEWRHVIRNGYPTIKFNEVDGMTVLSDALCCRRLGMKTPEEVVTQLVRSILAHQNPQEKAARGNGPSKSKSSP